MIWNLWLERESSRNKKEYIVEIPDYCLSIPFHCIQFNSTSIYYIAHLQCSRHYPTCWAYKSKKVLILKELRFYQVIICSNLCSTYFWSFLQLHEGLRIKILQCDSRFRSLMTFRERNRDWSPENTIPVYW